jgi:hypothetical protein
MVDAVALIFGCLYLLCSSADLRMPVSARRNRGIYHSTGRWDASGYLSRQHIPSCFSYRSRRAGAAGRLEGPGTPVLPDRGHCVFGAWAAGPDAPQLTAALLAHPGADLMTDNLLHLMTGIALSYFGFLPGPNSLRGSAQSHDRTGGNGVGSWCLLYLIGLALCAALVCPALGNDSGDDPANRAL